MPRHVLHGVSTITPFPRQRGHGWESAKSPWLSEITPRPVAVGARARRRARARPRAAADVAGRLDLDGNAHLDALEGVVERDADARLEIGAALGTRAAPARWPRPKNEPKLPSRSERSPRSTFSKRAPPGPKPCGPPRARLAEAVVRLPLLVIGEHVVGGLDVLEPLLRRRVVRVAVGMELAGELAVRLLDLVVGRGLRDAERRRTGSAGPRRQPSATTRARAAARRRRAGSRAGSRAAMWPGSTPSAGCVSSASWTCGSNGPSAAISSTPSEASTRGERVLRHPTPSSTFASSWCSAASSARSRSSSTGRSFATSRSRRARDERLLVAGDALAVVVEVGRERLQVVEVLVALALGVLQPRERAPRRRSTRRRRVSEVAGGRRVGSPPLGSVGVDDARRSISSRHDVFAASSSSITS